MADTKGDRVVVWYPSANYDEEVFEDPFRFDIRGHPNDHLTFGAGVTFVSGRRGPASRCRVVFEEL